MPLAHAQSAASVPPRTIHDITALLDQYQPDPARVEALKAALNAEPPKTDDRIRLAEFFARRAAAAQELGMIDGQIADLRRAAEYAKGWAEGEWDILNDLATAEIYAGNFLNSIKIKQETLRAVAGLRGRELSTYAQIAMLLSFVGDVREARSALRTAEAVGFQLPSGAWVTWGNLWTNLIERARGAILRAEGKHVEAENAFRKALHAIEEFLEVAPRLASDVSPLERWRGSRDLTERLVAESLFFQGRFAEAEVAMRNVLKSSLKRVGRYSSATGLITAKLSEIYSEQGRYRDAETLSKAALDIFEKSGSSPVSGPYSVARRILAAALAAQGQWAAAARIFDEMQRDLGSDPETLRRMYVINAELMLALIKTGRAAEAVPLLELGFRSARERLGEGNYRVAEQRGYLAIALTETGQRNRALAEFQEAIKVLLARSRADADEESDSPARVWRLAIILEGYIGLLYDMRNELRQPGFDPAAEAFRAADAARGGSAQRALAASAARAVAGAPALADLVRKEQDTKQQVATFYGLLTRMLSAPPEQQLQKVISDLRARIQELEKERRQLFAELEKRFPAYVDLAIPKPATVEEARGALREGEALVSVLVADERTYVWVVPKTGPVAFHATGLGEKQVSRMVAGLRRALDPGAVPLDRFPEFDVTTAHRLYAELLKPVAGAWKGAHTLMVVANGALAQLPFTVLPTEAVTSAADAGLRFERYKQVPWLVKHVAVTQLPAVNTLVTLRALPQGNPARSPFIGFGDPQFGRDAPPAALAPVALRMRNLVVTRAGEGKAVDWMPYSQLSPLPDTREEILAMAAALKADPQGSVFLGPAASKENVKKAELRTRRIVAFATHGLIPGDFPNLDEPALALSAPDGNAETGLLTLGDILELKMDADWVVLSACNTAAGEGQGAEAISGLGRGFFYAGSRALLVTHWPVETRSARELVTNLFERYAAQPVSRAEALRQASLAVMEDTAKDAGGKALFSYAHPLFWAPYALVGDGGR